MSVVSLNDTGDLTRKPPRPGLLIRMFEAICRARQAQAEEIIRLHGYGLRSTSVTQPSSETRRTS